MNRLTPAELEENSKRTSTAYFGGALITLGFSILTLGNAAEWFDYASGIVLLGVTVTFLFEGFRSIAKGRRSTAN